VRRKHRRPLCLLTIAIAFGTIAPIVTAEPAGAAISNVQTGTEKTSTTGSVAPTLPAASTAGTLLVAQLGNRDTSSSAPFSGPAGWVNATGVFLSGAGRVEIWYYPNNPGGITSATFTASSGTNTMTAELSEWKAAAFSSPVDTTGTVTTAGATTSTVSTSAATTVTGDIAFTAYTTSVTPITTFTAGSGWTHVFTDGTRGSVGDHKNGLATGVASETETATSSTGWAGVIVAFKPGCTGGSLTLTPPGSITFPAATLNGKDKTTTINGTFTANDQTNSGSGWNITGTSTTFTTGSHTLPTTATQITAASASAASQNCSLPTNSIGYAVTLPAAATAPAAVKLYNAAANTGAGPSTVTLTYVLTIPANARTGTYTSTWTFSIVSGP
jgi:hypothetical protein